jgi:hypothetical protein
MAGRGRAATLPAWMTQGTVPGANTVAAPAPAPVAQTPTQSSGGLGGSLGSSFVPSQPAAAPVIPPGHQTTSTQQSGCAFRVITACDGGVGCDSSPATLWFRWVAAELRSETRSKLHPLVQESHCGQSMSRKTDGNTTTTL